jgi:hypothetical protein
MNTQYSLPEEEIRIEESCFITPSCIALTPTKEAEAGAGAGAGAGVGTEAEAGLRGALIRG